MGRLDGDDSEDEGYGEFGLTGAPTKIDREILRLVERGEISRNNASDITVEMEEKEVPQIQACHQRLTDGSYGAIHQKAARQHQNQVWKTTMYRRVNDVSKTARPALKRYECMLVGEDATLPEYRRKQISKPVDAGYKRRS